MNINDLARAIAFKEGKKKQVDIAQIKEVLSCTQKILKPLGLDLYAQVRKIPYVGLKVGARDAR